ncbi:Prohibitin-2, subunit of the prohibitin complex (Phb1p-Phb2p) [Mycoemilia scoparia]|uniref:Prohibitin n=1 Tax=Mycoemilia scoparia TaxID=417184 RepID=A0A9W8A486_9FUNG|nr:Prohibitin-2, subunit of the prohibitin complex (Phb1p-Phb2p) [Mycoemilia scoparia]
MDNKQWNQAQKQAEQVLSKFKGAFGKGGRYPGGGGPPKGSIGATTALLGLGLLVWGGSHSLFNVDGGHRAIVYSRVSGVKSTIYGEGTHFRIPWIETPIIYHVRARPRSVQSLTGTKDLQMVNITCRVLSRPDANNLHSIYRNLGTDYDERVLPSVVNEVLKSVVARFNASQLITQRESISRFIRESLTKRAAHFNILLDDVSLTHITFSPDFTSAVEAKQIAQQDAQRAAFTVDRARQEKQSTIVRAEGEAQSAELIGEAVKNQPGYLELRRIEAAREIARTLSKSNNRMLLDSDSLLLNVTERQENSTGKK